MPIPFRVISNRLLVVCVDPERLRTYETAFRTLTPNVVAATTFEQGKSILLSGKVDILVTERDLYFHNGFVLAILARSRLRGVRSIVIGRHDPVMEGDLKLIDASYVLSDDMEEAMEAVREALARARPRRRWTRRRPRKAVTIEIDGHSARVLDMSYGGVRIEVEGSVRLGAPATVVCAVPQYGLMAVATSLWRRPAGPGRDCYGLAFGKQQTSIGSAWRAFVANMAGETEEGGAPQAT